MPAIQPRFSVVDAREDAGVANHHLPLRSIACRMAGELSILNIPAPVRGESTGLKMRKKKKKRREKREIRAKRLSDLVLGTALTIFSFGPTTRIS